MSSSGQKKGDPTAPSVTFDYIKSAHFRSIHADGAIGGPTPSGHIHIAFFNERAAIPRRIVHELKPDGTLGEIRETDTRNSIVREMDVDVLMNLKAAEALQVWLEQQIAELKSKNPREKG